MIEFIVSLTQIMFDYLNKLIVKVFGEYKSKEIPKVEVKLTGFIKRKDKWNK